MTKKELSNLYNLNRKIERLKEEIETVRDRAEKTTTIPSDMPRGGVVTDCKEELVYLQQMLEIEVKKSIMEQQRLENYISSIDDVLIQNIIAYRFVKGLGWKEIERLTGGNNTSKGLQMKLKRFLQKK